MKLHRIKKEILKKLSVAEMLRYRDLKPEDVEGNQFSYHLKDLIKKDLIIKEGIQYSLSSEGSLLVQQSNFDRVSVRAQPNIVSLLIVEGKDGLLLYKRGKTPFIGHWGFPYGKLHLSETIGEAASRELEEKTNLRADLSQIGTAYYTVRNKKDGSLISSILANIFYTKDFTGKLDAKENPVDFKTVKELKEMELIPGVAEIADQFAKWKRTKKAFFLEAFFEY